MSEVIYIMLGAAVVLLWVLMPFAVWIIKDDVRRSNKALEETNRTCANMLVELRKIRTKD